MGGWTNIAFLILLFNIFFNAGAVALDQAGVAATHDINPAPGGDFEEARSAADSSGPGGGGTATLIGLWSSLFSNALGAIVNAIPAAAMMKNVGVPHFLVNYFYAAQAFVIAFATIAFFRTGGGI